MDEMQQTRLRVELHLARMQVLASRLGGDSRSRQAANRLLDRLARAPNFNEALLSFTSDEFFSELGGGFDQ